MASDADRDAVRILLGREPQGAFEVVVRDGSGRPSVIANAPFLDDGRPMPTTYWLVDPELSSRIGTIEAAAGVKRAEAEVDPEELAEAHRRYGEARDATIAADHVGPRPSGGVGGTRRGVKCLHTHYANHLAGNNDPVGRWVEAELNRTDAEKTDAEKTDAGDAQQ